MKKLFLITLILVVFVSILVVGSGCGEVCTTNADCDDDKECTVDECYDLTQVGSVGKKCVNWPKRCDDGVECTVDKCTEEDGCVNLGSCCTTDADCPADTECDNNYCNSEGYCRSVTKQQEGCLNMEAECFVFQYCDEREESCFCPDECKCNPSGAFCVFDEVENPDLDCDAVQPNENGMNCWCEYAQDENFVPTVIRTCQKESQSSSGKCEVLECIDESDCLEATEPHAITGNKDPRLQFGVYCDFDGQCRVKTPLSGSPAPRSSPPVSCGSDADCFGVGDATCCLNKGICLMSYEQDLC